MSLPLQASRKAGNDAMAAIRIAAAADDTRREGKSKPRHLLGGGQRLAVGRVWEAVFRIAILGRHGHIGS